jgi:hypothetical protein
MIRIIVDEAICDKLTEVGDRAELCDKSGRVIGFFQPVPDDDYAGYESPLSDEELDRRAREGGGRSLEEIMADLEKRS